MAEAILVMTILGIIATVMITVMKPAQYKEKALKIKTTKVLSDLDQATEFIILNHSKDGTLLHLVAEDGSEFSLCERTNKEASDKLAKLYKKYLRAARKECVNNNCRCYKRSGRDHPEYAPNTSYFYLKDGACVGMLTSIMGVKEAAFPDGRVNGKTPRLKNVCGMVWLDINGEEEPNTDYKDTFILRYSTTGFAWDAEVYETEDGVNDEEIGGEE